MHQYSDNLKSLVLCLTLSLIFYPTAYAIGTSKSALTANSTENRFTLDSSGDCIYDQKTQLVWARDASLFSGLTWGQKNDNFTAQYQVSQMNTDSQSIGYHLCGYSDWRLPTRLEMLELLAVVKGTSSCSVPANMVNKSVTGFTNVKSERYWAACSHDSSHAWYVSMSNGNTDFGELDVLGYVWPVRGGN